METRIIKCDTEAFQPECVREAAACLHAGGLVAFPTETVYGLGGDGLNPKAAGKIYAAKGRPSDNPLILHIAEKDSVNMVAEEVSDKAWLLMERFWPGPLTLVLKKKPTVPAETTGGLNTVAVRMPSHPVALELIRQSGVCVAAPSANASGRPSPSKASHVYEDLKGKIDYILDGGSVDIGIESTIVDMTGTVPAILRPGYITPERIEAAIGKVEFDPAVFSAATDIKPKAPGMKYTHYAPKGTLSIVEGDREAVVRRICAMVEEKQAAGYKVGVLAARETADRYRADTVLTIGCRAEPVTMAARLYACLREFDEEGTEFMYSEAFGGDSLGNAIMNRLLKAAGHRVIYAEKKPAEGLPCKEQ